MGLGETLSLAQTKARTSAALQSTVQQSFRKTAFRHYAAGDMIQRRATKTV